MPPHTPESDDTSSLERLRRKLYAPQEPERFPAPTLGNAQVQGTEPVAWAVPEPKAQPVPQAGRHLSKAVLFLLIAGAFFLIAAASAAFFLIYGSRAVSTDRVLITPDGPPAIASGDRVSLLIAIENQNPVPISSTMLSVDLPETARDGNDAAQPLGPHWSDTLGDIEAGSSGKKTLDIILVGSENEVVIIPIRFEYRVEGSNAVFVKEASYQVTITSSPLSVRAQAVTEAQAGQPLSFAVTVRSNAKVPFENVAVKLDPMPFGFTLKAGQKAFMPIGTLQPGEERTVTLTGIVSAEDAEKRVFRFVAGTQSDSGATSLAVQYAKTDASVGLAKPFLASTLSVNRDSGDSTVISVGEIAQGTVTWVNTLPNPVLDGQVSVRLSGNALDASSVTTNTGFYRSSDTTVLYSKETDSGLARLLPGANGNGAFAFATKPAASLIGTSQPTIVATISIAGRRAGAGSAETIPSTLVRTIKVGTDLSLTARSVRSTGPFKNTGPVPPVADQESTYTIQFSLANTVNSVGDARVEAKLPSYVRYTGLKSPDDGSFSYISETRTVVWNAGDVAIGAGNTGAAKTMSFQVALLPSVSQRGTSPVLVFSPSVTGVDRFTKKSLSSSAEEVTARTLTDPAYQPAFGEVK